ncbi:MAG: SGNH/GDSL hydrolase family protein, partial [Christensenellales bacterium]
LGILLSCSGEGSRMNFSVDSVLNYKCVGGNCLMSRVGVEKLRMTPDDVSEYVKYSAENCEMLSAVYDDDNQAVTVTFGSRGEVRTVSCTVEIGDYTHPVFEAETTLQTLENKAISAKPGSTVLIGDSLFANWKDLAPLENAGITVNNFAVGGFCVSDLNGIVLYRLVLPVSPDRILIHVGVNDIFQAGKSSDAYLREVYDLIGAIRSSLPYTEICFVTIVKPTDAALTVGGHTGAVADARRAEIDKANSAMKEYCEENGIGFLDASDAYRNENGSSLAKYFYPDGIHLLNERYEAWGNAILRELKKQ